MERLELGDVAAAVVDLGTCVQIYFQIARRLAVKTRGRRESLSVMEKA